MPSWQGQAGQAAGETGVPMLQTHPLHTRTHRGLAQDLLGEETLKNPAISVTIMKRIALTNPLQRERTLL